MFYNIIFIIFYYPKIKYKQGKNFINFENIKAEKI